LPLARQERLDGGAALQKLRTIEPAAVRRVGQRDAGRVAAVPGVFGAARLLCGGLGGEGRQWWAVHRIVLDHSVSEVLTGGLSNPRANPGETCRRDPGDK